MSTEREAQWEALYRRAVNAANGLTNYVEDRPELRRIERELERVEADARALRAALAAPEREPMTEEQIDALHDGMFPRLALEEWRENVRKFARAIERHHGIGSKA